MASGYNQDTNQITPGMYRVVLTMSNGTYFPTATANTASGAVWPYDWTNPVYTNAITLTAAQALVLAQGNLRWQRIIESLSAIADCRFENVVVTATTTTDATSQPTGLAFTVVFDRDQGILGQWNNYLKSIGKSSSGTYTNSDSSLTFTAYVGVGGTAVTTLAIALQDIVTNALISGTYVRSWRVYDPANTGDSQVKVTIISPVATAAQTFGTVAVTQISGTTLAGTPV
jgi:hypothetical protein